MKTAIGKILHEQRKTNMLLEHIAKAQFAIIGVMADKGHHNLLKYSGTTAFDRTFANNYRDHMMKEGEALASLFMLDLEKFKDEEET